MSPGARSVLVVEDNADHAVLVRLAVQRVDPSLAVKVVSRGEVALAFLRDGGSPQPDLVILDLLRPGTGGFDLLERMVGGGEANGIPVVVLSSSESAGDRERAMDLGARAFHSKPSDLDDLGEVVEGILREWLP